MTVPNLQIEHIEKVQSLMTLKELLTANLKEEGDYNMLVMPSTK